MLCTDDQGGPPETSACCSAVIMRACSAEHTSTSDEEQDGEGSSGGNPDDDVAGLFTCWTVALLYYMDCNSSQRLVPGSSSSRQMQMWGFSFQSLDNQTSCRSVPTPLVEPCAYWYSRRSRVLRCPALIAAPKSCAHYRVAVTQMLGLEEQRTWQRWQETPTFSSLVRMHCSLLIPSSSVQAHVHQCHRIHPVRSCSQKLSQYWLTV